MPDEDIVKNADQTAAGLITCVSACFLVLMILMTLFGQRMKRIGIRWHVLNCSIWGLLHLVGDDAAILCQQLALFRHIMHRSEIRLKLHGLDISKINNGSMQLNRSNASLDPSFLQAESANLKIL